MATDTRKKRIQIVVPLLIIVLIGFQLPKWLEQWRVSHHKVSPTHKPVIMGQTALTPLVYTEGTARIGQKFLAQPFPKAVSPEAVQFFNHLLDNRVHKTFFYKTIDFFGDRPEAYPAARFVAITLEFETSPRMFQLQTWTQAELKKYSEQLMSTLEQKREEINLNPYFENRMLNLANQLNVSADRKFDFYQNTLTKPLNVLPNGGLRDDSLGFEIALLLAKQSNISVTKMTPVVSQAISANQGSPQQLEALRVRVVTYYPQLAGLFGASKQ